MVLKDFVKMYVCSNTLLRLWVPKNGWSGYVLLYNKDESKPNGVDDVCMGWELINNKCWQSKYCDCKVLGVTDIVVDSFYREAVNIVIDTEDDSDNPRILDTMIDISDCDNNDSSKRVYVLYYMIIGLIFMIALLLFK